MPPTLGEVAPQGPERVAILLCCAKPLFLYREVIDDAFAGDDALEV